MSGEDILLDTEERMEKAVRRLKADLVAVRTGRASPALVDSLRVEAYGSSTSIKAIASVSAPDPSYLVVRPFDPGVLKGIEKAILTGDLGLNPQNDGKLIRINIPPLTAEIRRKLVARIKELTEEAKVAIRNIRRDGNKTAERGEKEKQLTEDDRDEIKREIQELTKNFESQASDLARQRERDVMDN